MKRLAQVSYYTICIGLGVCIIWAFALGNWGIGVLVGSLWLWAFVLPRYKLGRQFTRAMNIPQVWDQAEILEYRTALQRIAKCRECDLCACEAVEALAGLHRKEYYEKIFNA